MRTSTSKEASIAKYFQTAPLATANVVLGIIRSTMKDRNTVSPTTPARKTRKVTRKPRAKKAATAPAPSPAQATASGTADAPAAASAVE